MTPVTSTDIIKLTTTLKNTRSVGHDGISTKVIKSNIHILAAPLTHIINAMISSGIFPDELKKSIVKPLFKGGDNEEVKNYRPISLVPILSKLFEKVIYSKMYSFFEQMHLISNNQNGFRKGRSTKMAIHDLLQVVTGSMDERIPVCALYMDMSKAFDYVNHTILLHKLNNNGIRGNSLKLLESYLSNRKQRTQINIISQKDKQEKKFLSNYRHNNYGVPQGSILGPLLFLIYINDLPKYVEHPMVLFADDCTVIVKCKDQYNYENEINNTFRKIILWLNDNNLILNFEKTKIMHFRQRLPQPKIIISYSDKVIESVDTIKFLGVTIDSTLCWKSHTEELCLKLNKFVFALRKLAHISSIETALSAYHGYISSILRYGIVFWGNSTNREMVFKSQKRCVRAIFNINCRESCRSIFQKYKILPVPCIYIFEMALFVKLNLDKYPHYIQPDRLRLRSKYKIYGPQTKTALLNNSIFSMAPKIYNKIPNNFKDLHNPQFKSKLSLLLHDKCYYSIDEFMSDKLLF